MKFNSIILGALALTAGASSAQMPLDVLNGGQLRAYPDYLDHGCSSGNATLTAYGPLRDNENGTVTQAYRAWTVCSTSGRGSVPMVYQACWAVTFDADTGAFLDRGLLDSYRHWRYGTAGVACPVLP